MDEREFRLLALRVRETWGDGISNAREWGQLLGEIELLGMAVRCFFEDDRLLRVRLEEHKDRADAWWASRRNDGSITPLRAFTWVRRDGGWEEEPCTSGSKET